MNTSQPTPDPRTVDRGGRRTLARAEDVFSVVLIGLMAILSLTPVVSRLFLVADIRGSTDYIRQLVLWIAFAGGAITSREGRHLALSFGYDALGARTKEWVRAVTSLIDVLFLTILTLASLSFSLVGFDPSAMVGIIPSWILSLVMPAGFLVMMARAIRGSAERPVLRWIAAAGILPGLAFGLAPLSNLLASAGALGQASAAAQAALAPALGALFLPLILLLVVSTVLGSPIYILLGGLAVLFSSTPAARWRRCPTKGT